MATGKERLRSSWTSSRARRRSISPRGSATSTLKAARPRRPSATISWPKSSPGRRIAQTEAALALFLAEHDRKLPEAVKIAEAVAAARHDIFTDDALAWAYYKTGRLDDAFAASERALRTGTRDERILAHAAAIRAARARS